VIDLNQLAKVLVEKRWHCDRDTSRWDGEAVKAIDGRDRELADRTKSLVDWLNYYKVLMGLPAHTRNSIAAQIIEFADNRQERALQRDEDKIVSEFTKLQGQISASNTQKQGWPSARYYLPYFKGVVVLLPR
jgi:hypothetical protein